MKTKSVEKPGTRLSALLPSLRLRLFPRMGALLLCAGISTTAWAAEPIAARTADVQGVKLHYLTSGSAAPLLLLHGYAETSLMWRPLMPSLAERFTVIALRICRGSAIQRYRRTDWISKRRLSAFMR